MLRELTAYIRQWSEHLDIFFGGKLDLPGKRLLVIGSGWARRFCGRSSTGWRTSLASIRATTSGLMSSAPWPSRGSVIWLSDPNLETFVELRKKFPPGVKPMDLCLSGISCTLAFPHNI